MALWGGRFTQGPDQRFKDYNDSLKFDYRMALEDIEGSIAWADAILRGGKLVADGREGLNGLMLSNAIHLSAFLGKEVEIPFDEDLFYDELMKRVADSKVKTNVKQVFADTKNTYGGNK